MPTFRSLTMLYVVILVSAYGCTTIESTPNLPTDTPVQPTETSISPPSMPTSVPLTATEAPPTASETPIPTFTFTPDPTTTQTPREMIKNIEYGSVAGEQKLDVYLPTDVEDLHPVVLLIHEGNGRKEQLTAWGKALAKQGYAAVSINYRGWPNYSYPQNISDAFCALAWIHANAVEYRFDTDYVFVLGHSSGGTLAALVGVIDDPNMYLKTCQHELPASNWVQGVVTFTGIFDYASASQSSSGLKSYAEALLGGSQEMKLDNWTEASAVTWVDGSEPPFLVFHGGNDHNIPPEQSIDFAKTLEAAGVSVELIIVPDADHYQITGSAESVEAVFVFLSDITPEK